MPVTLTSNFHQVFPPETVEIIDELKENYDLKEILEFVDAYGEVNIEYCEKYLDAVGEFDDKELVDEFITKNQIHSLDEFETYSSLIEDYDSDAVNAFISIFGVESLGYFEENYEGEFNDDADFVYKYMQRMDVDIPSWIDVDYQGTWDKSLRFDYVEEDGYYFRNF
jgi:hypothetical protein